LEDFVEKISWFLLHWYGYVEHVIFDLIFKFLRKLHWGYDRGIRLMINGKCEVKSNFRVQILSLKLLLFFKLKLFILFKKDTLWFEVKESSHLPRYLGYYWDQIGTFFEIYYCILDYFLIHFLLLKKSVFLHDIFTSIILP